MYLGDNKFALTKADKLKYLDQINKFDLSLKDKLMIDVPLKLNLLIKSDTLNGVQLSLIKDLVSLYEVINDNPAIDEKVQKKILFAMNYFSDENDEIPDSIPVFGFLDDAAIVSWIISDLKGFINKKVKS